MTHIGDATGKAQVFIKFWIGMKTSIIFHSSREYILRSCETWCFSLTSHENIMLNKHSLFNSYINLQVYEKCLISYIHTLFKYPKTIEDLIFSSVSSMFLKLFLKYFLSYKQFHTQILIVRISVTPPKRCATHAHKRFWKRVCCDNGQPMPKSKLSTTQLHAVCRPCK